MKMASSRLVRGICSALVAVVFGAASVAFAVDPPPSGATPAAASDKDAAARKEARQQRREERDAARERRDAARGERKAGPAEKAPDARRGSQGEAATQDKETKKEHRATRAEGERSGKRDKDNWSGKGGKDKRSGKGEKAGKGEKRRKGEVKPAPPKPAAAPVRRPPPRPVAPPPAPAPSVIHLSPVAGAGDSVIGDRTMTGCRIQSALPQAIAARNAKVKLTDRPVAGRVLTVKIVDVAARGGGIFSGSKGLGVEGRLYQDGRIVGSFTAHATSRGALSSCGILDKVVAELADQIAVWVDSPAMDSTLGAPR